MGTQRMRPGRGIPLHVHERADEIIFILRGTGTTVIEDDRSEVKAGSTIYIPAGVWHGMENSEQEMEAVWVVSPPGLDNFFRDLDTAQQSKDGTLTLEEINEIARKHGDLYK